MGICQTIDYRLTEEAVQSLDEAIDHAPEPEVRQRAMGLKLLHLGHTPEEVAEMLAVEQESIYDWGKRWQAEGIAREAYRELLEKLIEQDPAELGYGFTFCTTGRLLSYMQKETGVRLSPNRTPGAAPQPVSRLLSGPDCDTLRCVIFTQ